MERGKDFIFRTEIIAYLRYRLDEAEKVLRSTDLEDEYLFNSMLAVARELMLNMTQINEIYDGLGKVKK